MKRQTTVGIVLIVIGIVGLLFVGASGWGGRDGDWWRWHGGPMMRGFGRYPMHGPWWGPGRGPGAGGQVLPPVAGARTIDVVATDFSFKPSEISVKVGEVANLRLVNQGVTVHDLVVPAQGIWLVVPAGQSVTTGFRTDRAGQYEFFCSVPGHIEAGMTGKIVVTP